MKIPIKNNLNNKKKKNLSLKCISQTKNFSKETNETLSILSMRTKW